MKTPDLNKKLIFLWFALIFVNSFFISLVMVAPLIRHRWPMLSLAIYEAYAPFCHQIKERSFILAGEPLAICARCFGIMTGFFLSLIIYPLIRNLSRPQPLKSTWLIGLSFLMAVDLVGNIFHLWSSGNLIRFIIGLTWGSSLPFYLWPAAICFWLVEMRRVIISNKKT